MKKLDFYEFVGVLVPGAVLLFGVLKMFPELGFLFRNEKDITFGELGLFVILAYAVGHLVQCLGNGVETLWWRSCGGAPTDSVRMKGSNLLAPQQLELLLKQIRNVLKLDCPAELSGFKSSEWYSITRQMYAHIAKAGLAARIDVFNGNYGMFRGMVASLLILFAGSLIQYGLKYWLLSLVLAFTSILALLRMNRFAKHYARELFVQFLTIQPTNGQTEYLPKVDQ